MRRLLSIVLVNAALAAVPALGQAERPVPTSSADGFLHGEVTTRQGARYRGLLRWGSEEAFWGDLFNASKEDLDHYRHVPRAERRRDRGVEVFGIRITRATGWTPSRQFVARFGDIRSIEPDGEHGAIVTMKTGSRYEVGGGSNDVGATITVYDASLGEVELRWRSIDRIELSAAPARTRPWARRMWGRVATDGGAFEGFVQWDSEECVDSDTIEGDSDDGRMSIELGRIRSIAKHGRDASRLVLADGRELVLDGTNDVDGSIRGIFVEDARFGRVKVSWDAFERVDLSPRADSGPAYGDFRPHGELSATVTDRGGRRHAGRLVYDVDEAEGWEMLHGVEADVEYLLPFDLVAAVAPRGRHSALVTLRDGTELRLSDTQDVSEDNDGVLVFPGEGEPVYVRWDEVGRIELAP